MMWGYGHGMAGWGYLLMTLSTVAVWVLVALLVLALMRAGGRDRAAAPVGRAPEGVLADRLARGEIDETEYRSRLGALRENGPTRASESGP